MKDLSVYVLVSFIACVTPGSGVLYTVTNGLRGGLRTVLASPLGTTLGVGLMSLISATGLGALITSSPALYAGLQLVSAAVLFWLGWGSWNAGAVRLDKLGRLESNDSLTFSSIFKGALYVQASNVMLIVFLLSLMPQFISPEDDYVSRVTLLSVLFVGICFLVHLGYSAIAAVACRPELQHLAQPRQRRSLLASRAERHLERTLQPLESEGQDRARSRPVDVVEASCQRRRCPEPRTVVHAPAPDGNGCERIHPDGQFLRTGATQVRSARHRIKAFDPESLHRVVQNIGKTRMSTPEHNRPTSTPLHEEGDVVREGVGDLVTSGSSLEHVVEDKEPRVALVRRNGEGDHFRQDFDSAVDGREGEACEKGTASARPRRIRITPSEARDLSRRPKLCRRSHAEDVREARRMIEVAVGKRKILNPLRSNAKRPKVVKENMENASRVPEQIAGRRSDEGGESPFGIKPLPLAKVVDNDRDAGHDATSSGLVKAGGDLVNRGPNARSSLHYTPEDFENSTPIPPDPPFRALRRLLTLLAALLAGVAAGLIVPVLAGFGERGLAVGIATTALILLGVGIRDRVRDPDGRAGSLFIGAGIVCVFLLIVVLV